MKIGIVSMHRVKNNGSFLQGYALYNQLKAYGNDVKFIDFEDEIHKDLPVRKQPLLKRFLKILKGVLNKSYRRQLQTNRCRDEFNNRYNEFLKHVDLTPKLNLHNGEEFDLLVIGSDEVFNICQYSAQNKNIPWELLGEGINAKKIITYAASCGQTDVKKIQELSLTEKCKNLLSKFSAISVRDDNTFNFVSELTDITPIYNIDPVLWQKDFPKEKEYKKLNKKYLLVYAYTMRMNSKAEQDAIKAYAKKHNLKTVCVNCYQPWCDIKITTSPFNLLQYIKDAECVITDTFHGTVFSIRNNTRFITIVRESNKNKLRSLLKQFSLLDREVLDLEKLEETLDAEINFKHVNDILDRERKASREYIEKFIG